MRYHEIAGLPSVKTIEALRPEIAHKAQEVYDAWEPGEDDEYAGGGICHVIADQIVDILSHHSIDCVTVTSNFEVHVYVVARCQEGIFEVDIPYQQYETGAAYTWEKIPNVRFTPDFVHIGQLDRDPNRFSMYAEVDEDLMEAPIGDIHVLGDPNNGTTFDQGTGFDDRDQKFITRGREHFIRAFSRTPHVFEIFFINDADIDGFNDGANELVDDYATSASAGVHDAVLGVQGKPGVIRHVQISNLSPIDNRMPMTPWILAHKIAHAIQDSLDNMGDRLTDLTRHVQRTIRQIATIIYVDSGEPAPKGGRFPKEISYNFPLSTPRMMRLLTMRSARTGRITNGFEVWAEIVAQYLTQGAVAMDVGPNALEEVDRLNAMLCDLFNSLRGKVLMEV